MKTVFRLTTLFYAILLCTPSFAQKKTVTGFYISVQGDTVKGVFPNYSQWSNNPSEVEFAAAASVEPTTLTPQNCRNFVIEGHDEYLSYAGQRLVNPIYDNEVSKKRYSNLGDEQEEVVTFLRLVTRTPNCELYVFTDNKRPNFFYRLPGDSVVELKYKKYYFENQLDVSGFMRGYIAEITDYKGQLNSLFAEAIYRRKLTSALNTLPYAEDRLKMFLEQLFSTEPVKHKKKSCGGMDSFCRSFTQFCTCESRQIIQSCCQRIQFIHFPIAINRIHSSFKQKLRQIFFISATKSFSL